ncbi:carboxypeptidase-like regulatory domain-containing protein [Fischerella sp. PCC 9605]|uniref:carboxypeptidase-like regulatory domain-containing protein n=1 Tax=Fischerella sp. PCC 9605 TaxID=1173024 RepID=UPI00047AB0AD|nr:carboxypeptidase-like regulatory domain-containing protein [Fischerella sp. PCC 9605]
MFYQPSTLPPPVTIVQSENTSCITPVDASVSEKNQVIAGTIAAPSTPETLPPEFSTDGSQHSCTQAQLGEKVENQSITANNTTNPNNDTGNAIDPGNKQLSKKVVAQSTTASVTSLENTHADANHTAANTDTRNTIAAEQQQPSSNNLVAQESKASTQKNNPAPNIPADNILATAKSLLVGVFINEREVGSLEVIPEGNTLLIPLDDFAQIADLEVEKTEDKIQLKTPLGVVTLTEADFKKIEGITYISDTFLKENLLTNIELKTSDLALNVDLPWRRSGGQSGQAIDLQPEVRPPSSGLSNLRQELNYHDNSGRTNWRTSTLLGGRLAGGAWRLRLDNNFVNNPQLSEYFYFKRSGQFLYQIGKQQLALNPVLSGLNLTGLQFGYTNLSADRFNTSYSASELLPRRSQPTQTFRGVVPPASFVQLRVGGVVLAQQQVGLGGEYDFQDVRLPIGQTSDIELLVYERNNLSVPIEIRSLSLNSSDLLLPASGNLQLAGLGVTGNWLQNSLFDDFNSTQAGKFAGFYQIRQGVSNDLTLEAGVQVLPETTQAQVGFAWRLASPLILSANVGTSAGELAYKADLDFQLSNWRILGTSELYPKGYLASFNTDNGRDRQNHSLDASYKFSDDFTLGLIARSYQSLNIDSSYILPTFFLRPARNLSFRGSPNYSGDYVFGATYQPTRNSRLLFNAYGDIYTSDFSYDLNRQYRLSFGTESGGDLATRYTLTLGRNAQTLSGLSWRLGLGYREGEIGPFVGASMRILPGLFASIDYQGIPSRYRNIVGSIGDDRLTISLISDLSFAGGSLAPAEYSSISKDRGAIAGRIIVEGGRKNTDLSGGIIQVYNNRGRNVGAAKIDSQGNFFVGNLREGVYVVQLDPDELPIEIALRKTSIVAEVASSAVTKLDFPVGLEYGLAGRITDVSGQPMAQVQVELVGADGKPITSAVTDESGLYRLDGVPVGKYTLQIPSQDAIAEGKNLPKRGVEIRNDFVYEQNLQLPISAAARKNEIKAKE